MEQCHELPPESDQSTRLLRLFADASRILAASFDYETLLNQVARLMVPVLADSCIVDLIAPDGTWQAVGVANINPAYEVLIRHVRQRYPLNQPYLHATDQAILLPTVTDEHLQAITQDAENLALLRTLRMGSALVVPLVNQRRIIGTILLGRGAARPAYTQQDLQVAEGLAAIASLSITNANLYREAKTNATYIGLLQTITEALAQAHTPTAVEGVIVERIITNMGATAGSLVLLTPDSSTLLPVRMQGYSTEIQARWQEIPLDAPVPIAEAVRRQEAIWLHSPEEWANRYPQLVSTPMNKTSQAWAALPLIASGQVLGAIGLSFASPQAFAAETRELLITLAHHSAQAIERARLFAREQQARQAIEATIQQHAAIAELGQYALNAEELVLLFDAAVTQVARTLNVAYVALYEWLPDSQELHLRAGVGWHPKVVEQTTRDTKHHSHAAYTLHKATPITITDLATETRFVVTPLLKDHQIVSGAGVVIRGRQTSFGVLAAYTTKGHIFTTDEMNFLQTVATILASANDRAHAEAERLEAERQLQEAQKLESLGVLAGGVAHDFNNLLAVILGNTHLVRNEIEPTALAQATLDQIEHATQRAADLTHQLLAFVGKGRFVAERLNLSTLVEELQPLLQAAITSHLLLRCDLAPDLPYVEVDPTQLRQVLLNLVVNAAESIGEQDGYITVTTSICEIETPEPAQLPGTPAILPGRYVCLEVADTGIGMDTETQVRIFEPFFTTKFMGRGLGLPAVLGIVRRHNGSLRVESTPNVGTRFTVLLPALNELRQVVEEPVATRPWYSNDLVLVIEDETLVRRLLNRLLTRLGFSVVEAPDGQAGLDIFCAHATSLRAVILDLTMPVMGGEEAFRALRQIRPDIPVLVMSGYTEEEIARRFVAAKQIDFLAKPFTPASLEAKLEALLAYTVTPKEQARTV